VKIRAERQLAAVGLPAAQIVYGCPISTWMMLNGTGPDATVPDEPRWESGRR
jgi:hypothetical protein